MSKLLKMQSICIINNEHLCAEVRWLPRGKLVNGCYQLMVKYQNFVGAMGERTV